MVQAIKRDEVFIEPEGIHVETHQPERRSRKPPILLIHGALTGSWLWSSLAAYFAERGWEAHAMNFRGHYTSDVADLASVRMDDYVADIGVAMRHLGRPAILVGWGMGGLAALRYVERHGALALILLAPSPPAPALSRAPAEHELKQVPPVYDGNLWNWLAPIDELAETMPDMTDAELEKMRELLLGARDSGRARRERMVGVEIDPSRIALPALVIGAGLDDVVRPSQVQRTADLIGAAYEYFPEASHFGLVMGSGTWPDVARSVHAWLEERRAPLTAAAAGAARG